MEIRFNLFGNEIIARIIKGSTKKSYEKFYIKSSFEIRNENKQGVIGYTNRCYDGKYVIFLDYDRIQWEHLKGEIKELQRLFKLGDFHIFESSEGSYHAVCFSKVPLEIFVSILHNSSIDPEYVRVPLKYGKRMWTLRLSPKNAVGVRYCGKVKSKYSGFREESLAHILLVSQVFNQVLDTGDTDNSDKVITCEYPI